MTFKMDDLMVFEVWKYFLLILVMTLTIKCCEDGTFSTEFLGDCLPCPLDPENNCSHEDPSDVNSCLKSCTDSMKMKNEEIHVNVTKTAQNINKSDDDQIMKPNTTSSFPNFTTTSNFTKIEAKPSTKYSTSPTKNPLERTDNESYIGHLPKDAFMVLVMVLGLGLFIVMGIILRCRSNHQKTNRSTCAGYRLVYTKKQKETV
ncbi:uncharacterized protein LOC124447102 [Xenia sp. Carnegie-2017]|uniref:uncharacterized protein LOC124447102 n=1 Tax=Xenia sp. Carnegie-2017 TaxID=2897299 RepID=UPI001F04675A|nr:uncharacterized protein LOC124447102 [Xenia sp. Carnegie-2017]